MVDRSCDEKTENEIRQVVAKVPGVERVDRIKTRLFGSKIYVDIEIAVDGEMLLKDAHAIAEEAPTGRAKLCRCEALHGACESIQRDLGSLLARTSVVLNRI